jgi:hypothetical protein
MRPLTNKLNKQRKSGRCKLAKIYAPLQILAVCAIAENNKEALTVLAE